MNIGRVICGTIAAIAGAVVWAAIAYCGNVEIGYLAWGIGLLVGLAVSFGSKSGGIGAAAIAVVLTILSLVGGKYATVQLLVSNEFDIEIPEFVMNDEDMQYRLAVDSIRDDLDAGKKPKFRNGKNLETATELDDLPAKAVATVKKQFGLMTEQEKETRREEFKKEYELALAAFSEYRGEVTNEAFLHSFSPFDIIFFLLGIVTAGKVAMSDVID